MTIKLDNNGKDFIRDELIRNLKKVISDDYVVYVAETLFDDVCDDIEASADIDFSDEDIRYSVGRVLVNKLGIEI